ncbi:MAG: hypothetical protein FRX49_02813 [Trebouxia sp. A1-2]|nr:MAG: hypothetical protein FRX49_02813 [Trebouxia sp. A1-2]
MGQQQGTLATAIMEQLQGCSARALIKTGPPHQLVNGLAEPLKGVCYSIASPLTPNKNGRPSKQIHTQLQDVEAQRECLCPQATLPPDQP